MNVSAKILFLVASEPMNKMKNKKYHAVGTSFEEEASKTQYQMWITIYSFLNVWFLDRSSEVLYDKIIIA
jgi:hypothetical protein